MTVTVGTGAGNDYATLADASRAFSAVSGGINREWTLLITSDLTETTASWFGNTFGPGGKLIIKPAPSTQPTVTFQIPAAPSGIWGDIVFGVSDGFLVTAANDFPSDGNYVIDGSNTVGGTTRDLTFQVPSTFNDPMSRVIRVWGDTKNMVIKNVKVITRDNSGTSYCIGLGAGVAPNPGGTPRRPQGITIENCYLEAIPAGTSGFGVEVSVGANGTLPPGLCLENIVVRNCDIVAKQRGISVILASGVIENNRVTIDQGSGTTVIYAGIFPFNNNVTPGGSLTIRNNVVTLASVPAATAGSYGAIGIYCESGLSGTALSIHNNVVKGFNFTATTGYDMLYRGISIGQTTGTVLVEHNSIDCPPNATAVVSSTSGRVAGIAQAGTKSADPTIIRNNIVRMGNPSAVAACIYAAVSSNLVCEGNDLVPNGSPNTARIGSTNYATLADWQAAGFDLAATGSQSVDPASVNPPWDSNLKFSLKPVGLGQVASSTILTDIDGDTRPATGAYPGADEPPGPAASVADWALF